VIDEARESVFGKEVRFRLRLRLMST